MPNLLMLMGVLQIMLSQHHFLNTLHTRNIFHGLHVTKMSNKVNTY